MRQQQFSRQYVEELKRLASKAIDEIKERAFEISRFMYENPETGYKEFRASELLTSELERHGFTVSTRIAGMRTSFTATLKGKSEGPTIAILAEYDALPGIGHGCGHNIIASSAVAAAIGLSKVLSRLPGELLVIGTPNEEGGAEGGKIRLVEAGVFTGVDVAMMVHPDRSAIVGAIVHPKLTEDMPPSLALGAAEIRFRGKATHASATPEVGINALDAVILTFVGLNALRQHIRDDSRIHGIITEGGKAPNIVPDEAAAYFYVRATDTDYMWQLVNKLRMCAEGAAIATGAQLNFRQSPQYMSSVKTNYALARVLENNLVALGERVERAEKKDKNAGSTDLGNVSQVVPTACQIIAVGPENMLGHSREMTEASVSEAGMHGLLVGAKAMALSCIDLFTQPEILESILEEFRKD